MQVEVPDVEGDRSVAAPQLEGQVQILFAEGGQGAAVPDLGRLLCLNASKNFVRGNAALCRAHSGDVFVIHTALVVLVKTAPAWYICWTNTIAVEPSGAVYVRVGGGDVGMVLFLFLRRGEKVGACTPIWGGKEADGRKNARGHFSSPTDSRASPALPPPPSPHFLRLCP